MKCPYCGCDDTRVMDSRPAEDGSSIRRRRECTAYAPCVHIGVIFLQILPYRLGRTDFLEHAGVLLSALVAEILGHHGNHQVGSHKTGLVVHEHHAVCIAVVDDTDICAALGNQVFKRLHVLGNQRVRLVIGEAAVDGIEEPLGILILIYLLREEVGHSVGKVEGDLEVAVIPFIFLKESEIVGLDINFRHLTGLGGLRGGTAFLYPFLDLAETCVKTNGEGVLAGYLHAVVLGGIVGCGNLHGSLVAIVRGAEIHQRCAAEADIIHIRTGIGDAFDEIIVDFGG